MPNVNELLREYVTLDIECMDRIYLNGYKISYHSPGGTSIPDPFKDLRRRHNLRPAHAATPNPIIAPTAVAPLATVTTG